MLKVKLIYFGTGIRILHLALAKIDFSITTCGLPSNKDTCRKLLKISNQSP